MLKGWLYFPIFFFSGMITCILNFFWILHQEQRSSPEEKKPPRFAPKNKKRIPSFLSLAFSNSYEGIETVAEGGMGIVLSGWDRERMRKVAIKTILPELMGNQEAVKLFLHECQVIQSFNHPNIVRIFEVGQKNFLYYVMEYLDGETVEDIMNREKCLPVELAVKIGTQVSRALNYLHSTGLVHRDIKPSNLFLIRNDVVKLIDFGVIKLLSSGEKAPSSSSAGSFLYASPEQIQSEEIMGKSDVYSLGICLFYMLTGKLPFSENDPMARIFGEYKKIQELNPNLSAPLVNLIESCLKPAPVNRISAHELWIRLRAMTG
ncbi:MAG: serine/threonine protein kinase [Candidatus Aureabacteria bacterium]|nr:serine/threonine protein kinase [Candidatus Auribacterota bacterium]